jgi:CBS domain-containing protein
MLRSGRRQRLNGYDISIHSLQIRGHVEGLAVVVQMYREIMNVDAAFGIFADSRRGRITVIGRSDSEELNVGAVMRELGGGGHGGAGSAQIRNLDSEAVERRIVDYIRGQGPVSARVSDMMSFPVYTVRPEMPMSGAAVVLREKGCTGVPVVDGEGKLVGVLSRRDFRKIRRESQLDAPVKAFMSSSVTTIGPAGSPQEAARLMVRHDIGRLPVVKDDRLIGIVTRTDAMAYFYDLLPG